MEQMLIWQLMGLVDTGLLVGAGSAGAAAAGQRSPSRSRCHGGWGYSETSSGCPGQCLSDRY